MNTHDHRFELACRYHDSGQTGRAIDELTQLLAEQPDESLYHTLLASCLLRQKRLVAALHESAIALKLDASIPFNHYVRSQANLLDGKINEAMENCDDALQLDPEYVDALLLQASIYEMQGDKAKRKPLIDRAAKLEPENIDVIIAYGEYHNSRREYQEALNYAREALRINAQSDDANVLMGETLLHLGDVAEAEYHAKFAIMQNPECTPALRLFANIKLRKNKFIGLWWRFNTWAGTLDRLALVSILIGGFLVFNISAEVAADFGRTTLASVLNNGWLIIVLYSWIGLPYYQRVMAREIEQFSFNKDF